MNWVFQFLYFLHSMLAFLSIIFIVVVNKQLRIWEVSSWLSLWLTNWSVDSLHNLLIEYWRHIRNKRTHPDVVGVFLITAWIVISLLENLSFSGLLQGATIVDQAVTIALAPDYVLPYAAPSFAVRELWAHLFCQLLSFSCGQKFLRVLFKYEITKTSSEVWSVYEKPREVSKLPKKKMLMFE